MKTELSRWLAWVLFYAGHYINKPTDWGKWNGWWMNFYGKATYPIYNWLMLRSAAVTRSEPDADGPRWPWGDYWKDKVDE
jgi:hypothetical protein